MKKFFLVALLALFAVPAVSARMSETPEMSSGQKPSDINSVKTLYQKYENNPKVSTVYISKAMFELIGALGIDSSNLTLSVDTGAGDFKVEDADVAEAFKVLSTLKGLYILSTEDAATAESIRKDVSVDSDYEELMKVRDGGDRVDFYYKSPDGIHVSEFLMLAYSDEETVIIQFEADGLTLEDVARLAAEMGGK